jgi:hypothetical protein
MQIIHYICDEIKKKKYRTIVTLLKSNQEFVETEENLIQLIRIYMTAHFPGLVSSLQ